MADTLPNVIVPRNEWVDLYALTGIAVGNSIQVQNVGSSDVYLAVKATQPENDFDKYNVVARRNGLFHRNEEGASGFWAYSQSVEGKLSVGEYPTPKTIITDENKVLLQLDPLVKSIPVTDTFHHLGHEGKVFIHSDRHSGIADGANFDILVRIPAGNAARQVHMRFNYIGKALTGSLDIDVMLYRGVTASADGVPEGIVSTNDAVVKSTGVLMFGGPTITDLGTLKTSTLIVGEKKSASSKEQAVPEWILAPDGANARDYLMRATNNSGGEVDIVNAIFFYDSEAA